MPPSSGELWGHHLMPPQVGVDILFPNGIILSMFVSRDAMLESVKEMAWGEVRRYPLYNLLLDPSSYIFVSVTQDGIKEEFYDETRRFCDLRLFTPFLRVVEPKGNRDEKMLNYEIGMTIGMSPADFNEMKDIEVMTFRRNVLEVCYSAVKMREEKGKKSLALYAYAPDVESSAILPVHLETKLRLCENAVVVCIWVVSEDQSRTKFSIRVKHQARPIDVISETIRRRSRMMGISKEHAERCIEEYSSSYALKVCGSDEFLLEEYPISQYKYVRNCIALDKPPQFMLLTREGIYNSLPDNTFTMPSYAHRGLQALMDINNQQTLNLWNVNVNLRIQFLCATSISVNEVEKIFIRAGIFHGTESLCEPKDTQEVDCTNPRWNDWLEFLYLPDIPRCARLCVALCCVAKSKKNNKKVKYPLAWGNIQLFDFNDRLLNEKISLNLWPVPQGMEEMLNPIGVSGSNPEKETPCIEIEFDKLGFPVSFPPDEEFEQLAHLAASKEKRFQLLETSNSRKKEEEQLDNIFHRDPLSELYDQEKELIWKRRDYCIQHPESLSKLLQATRWNDREQVALLYMLLKQWPLLQPEVALELLDCSFPDLKVRAFATECFEKNLSDDKLQQYLLQLVQALKFEPYLDSPIARFLLKRALLNQRIGQYFFWHLKSEMHQLSIRDRFGLVLEAFCRGCGPFLRMLTRQVEALDKITKLTDMLKSDEKQEQLGILKSHLQQLDYQEALVNFMSPLNNSHRLGDLNLEKCRIMNSKKKPLWLVWSNPDSLADIWFPDYKIIFKNGDDLRQDMLTLQVIRVMDALWKNEGLDLRLIPYGCVATGKDIGVIEIVRKSKTIMEIQSKKGYTSAIQMDSRALHKWIMDNNREPDQYERAIETFTRSCAGYCVATFVLGIGDRHSENIMCTEEGQVFHIDFGHFLNHKKKKFGISRERVPFVLTEDFMRVITKDSDKSQKQASFKKFAQMCMDSYLVLRKHAHLLINLFTMMLSCGIPELQTLDDISYLRKTLAVEKTEEEAITYFSNQFNMAVGDQWKQKVDWFFHFMKHR